VLQYIGEWSAAWGVQGANKTDYQRFAKVQQDVYGNATFGWAYWTLQSSEPLSTLEHDVYDSEWNHHTEELEIIANIYTNYNKYDYYSTRINKPISVQRNGPWT
jgi:hypothetical protein